MDQLAESSKTTFTSILDSSPARNESTRIKLLTELGQSAKEFHARLKSYRRWMKPSEVSPWWCSRYGWICVENDLLQCVDCRQYLSGHLPPASDNPILHMKVVNRLRGLLIEAHTKTCGWRSNAINEDACAPNVTDYEQALNDFISRLQSLLPYFQNGADKKYRIDDTIFDEKTITEADVLNLIDAIKASGADITDVSTIVCLMALLGWRADDSCKDCVICDFCLRRLGLWLFRDQRSSTTESSSSVGELEGTQQSPKSVKRLNPIAQHHRWCPWLMAVTNFNAILATPTKPSDSELDFIPNWLALFRLLANRGVTAGSTGTPLNKDEISEHYTLARQLLNEALDLFDDTDDPNIPSSSEDFTL